MDADELGLTQKDESRVSTSKKVIKCIDNQIRNDTLSAQKLTAKNVSEQRHSTAKCIR